MKILKEIIVSSLSIIVTTLVLARFSDFVEHLLTIDYDWKFELLMVIGQVIFQCAFILKKGFSMMLEYASKLLLISLFGALMLLPLIALNSAYPQYDLVNLSWFFSVVTIMFFLHKSFINKMKLPWYLSYTWVLYRCLVLILII